MDATALPKGHIIGWAPPPKPTATPNPTAGMSKSAKKNAKRKEKREAQRADESPKVKDNWEDDDEDEGDAAKGADGVAKPDAIAQEPQVAKPKSDGDSKATQELVKKLEGLDVR